MVLAPAAVLGLALGLTAAFAASPTTVVVDVAALVVALAGGLVAWHYFTVGVVTRLERLERDAERLDVTGTSPRVPAARDEIGRLAERLDAAAHQVRVYLDQRDEAQRELTDVLTASPVVSLRYDVARRTFSYASPNVDRLLGLSAEEAMADPAAVVTRFHPEDATTLRELFVGGRGHGDDRITAILRCRTSPDSEDWREVEATYTADFDERGRPTMVAAYLVDVSERHAAQRAAETRRFMLESIFHASPDTIVVRDAQGKVVLASSSIADLVVGEVEQPIDPDTVIEEAYRHGRLRREERLALHDMLRRCQGGERDLPPVITTGRPRQGGYRTFETRARPIFDEDGRVTGTVTVSRDITDRIELEQSLRKASVEAERASEAKSEFLSRMSHELRTPLNAILGFAQLLELDELTDDQSSSIDQIQRAGRHLLSLINEVLDISRIEAGQLTVTTQAVGVRDVLQEVTSLLVPVAEAATIHMMVETDGVGDVAVRADRQRLLQVLLNLGSNAVKYNEPGGTVSFRAEQSAEGRIRFAVRDSGPGIPLEQQDRLFVPFSRLGAERSHVEGTGVGLALSKQLVEVMGGTIGVESAPGRGSTFWVELQQAEWDPVPVSCEPAEQPPEELGPLATNGSGPAGVNGSLVVLHVEDNDSNASFVAQVLARRPGVRLVAAADATSGMELARRHRPHLVLLDLHLPDLPGDEVLDLIKHVPELADTKVVVVSADATPERIRRMLDQGVDGYLTKPVDVEALLKAVDDEARRRGLLGS